MELCGAKTLSVYTRDSSSKRISEEEAFRIFNQIVLGVGYIHDHNFAHRDLKMTNILIDHNHRVKIIDFGFACTSLKSQNMYCGTPSYMPPEIVSKATYAAKPVDIWTIGCVLYKLLTADYPFGGRPDLT
jgi:serine/threonine protein kinase